MSDLLKLAKPFPASYIHKAPRGGGDYVEHGTVTQALLATVGSFDFHVKEFIRGDVAESKTAKGNVRPALHNAVVGVVGQLSVWIDGERVTVEEVGDVGDPQNWDHDGQRGKDAMSDALKRCAMRLGCGLHLWAGDEYFLYDSLSKKEAADGAEEAAQQNGRRRTDDLPARPDTPAPSDTDGTDRDGESPSPVELQEVAPPAPGNGGPGFEGKDPGPPSAGLKTKRALLKALAKGKRVDLEEHIKPIGKSFESLDETDLDTLIDELKEAS